MSICPHSSPSLASSPAQGPTPPLFPSAGFGFNSHTLSAHAVPVSFRSAALTVFKGRFFFSPKAGFPVGALLPGTHLYLTLSVLVGSADRDRIWLILSQPSVGLARDNEGVQDPARGRALQGH